MGKSLRRCKWCKRVYDYSKSGTYQDFCSDECYEAYKESQSFKNMPLLQKILIIGVLLITAVSVPGKEYMIALGFGQFVKDNDGIVVWVISAIMALFFIIVPIKINKFIGIIIAIAYFVVGFLFHFGVLQNPGVLPV